MKICRFKRVSSKLNILLINPQSPSFVKYQDKSIPIGLLYLASTLKKHGFGVKFIDVNNDVALGSDLPNLDKDEDFKQFFIGKYKSEIDEFKPDLIGVGCLFSGRFVKAAIISSALKQLYPNAPIVLGGIHPTIFPGEILRDFPCVDYIILGEGERSFLELVSAHFDNLESLKNIDGLAYRADGQIFINQKTKFIEELDDLPSPAFDMIDLKKYYFDTSKWYNPKKLPINIPLPILSSRSCPNQCNFCSMYLIHGKKFRQRSADNVVDEIEYLYNKYNHRYFSFMDDNLTFSKERIIKICEEIIRRRLNIQFDTPNGVSIKNFDKELLDLLVQAGLIRMCIAPESGSEYIRNQVIRKGLSEEKIYSFIDLVKDYPNLFVKAFFVIGFPEETLATLEDTYQMIKKIMPPLKQIAIFNAVPFPGTRLFNYSKDNNLLLVPTDNLHKSSYFSIYDQSDNVFIKPHDLEISEIVKFHQRVDDYIDSLKTNS